MKDMRRVVFAWLLALVGLSGMVPVAAGGQCDHIPRSLDAYLPPVVAAWPRSWRKQVLGRHVSRKRGVRKKAKSASPPKKTVAHKHAASWPGRPHAVTGVTGAKPFTKGHTARAAHKAAKPRPHAERQYSGPPLPEAGGAPSGPPGAAKGAAYPAVSKPNSWPVPLIIGIISGVLLMIAVIIWLVKDVAARTRLQAAINRLVGYLRPRRP